jgi:hypothetical protein
LLVSPTIVSWHTSSWMIVVVFYFHARLVQAPHMNVIVALNARVVAVEEIPSTRIVQLLLGTLNRELLHLRPSREIVVQHHSSCFHAVCVRNHIN